MGLKGQIIKLKMLFKNMPILSNFVPGFQKYRLFLNTTIRNIKRRV